MHPFMKAGHAAQPPTLAQTLRGGGGNPAQAMTPIRPEPPVAAILHTMVSKQDLQDRMALRQDLFTGPEAAGAISQFFWDDIDIQLAESTQRDTEMSDPYVEFEDSSE